jgi:acyl-CoA synthetase (AMP-forming)/AMP-acid ligase II
MVEPGATVALVLPNSIEFHLAYFAALKALAAPAPLNPVYPAAQLSPLLREAIPRAMLCAPATREMAGEMIDPAEISAHCAPRLVNYKCPSEVRVVEQLPLTAAHKLDRAALRRAGRGEEPPPA